MSYLDGDFMTPAFEHAVVRDAMRAGVFTCPADMPLTAVARVMATRHIHTVVVTGVSLDGSGHVGRRAWGVISDGDVVRAARDADRRIAGDVASLDVVTVTPDTSLAEAADAMTEHGITHLVVVDAHTAEPVGMLSGLDIAGNIAWARA